jgi:hypothetical protein
LFFIERSSYAKSVDGSRFQRMNGDEVQAPVASDKHFLVKLVLAAPRSFRAAA